jgi:putative pyrroloquinoline-quinone-binding quinoprotein
MIYGCAYGAYSPLRASVMADHCRRRAYGAITAVEGIPLAICAALVPLAAGWQAPGQVTGSPVVGGNTAYSLSPGGGKFYALDTVTDSVHATISVGTTSRFATPTLFQNIIFVGTLTGIVAVEIRT